MDFPKSPPVRFKYKECRRHKVRILVGGVPMVIDYRFGPQLPHNLFRDLEGEN
jgi:hypothetical protein